MFEFYQNLRKMIKIFYSVHDMTLNDIETDEKLKRKNKIKQGF